MRYSTYVWFAGILWLGGTVFYHTVSFGGEEYDRLFPWAETASERMKAAEPAATQPAAALVRAIDRKPAPDSEPDAIATHSDVGAAKPEETAAADAGPQSETRDASETEQTAWVRVVGSRVNMRARPHSRARRVTSYRRDTRLQVIGRQGAWVEVRDAESESTGWMLGRYLVEVPAPREALVRPAETPAG